MLRWLTPVLCLLLAGCGSLPEPQYPPKLLTDINVSAEDRVELDIVWQDFAAKGAGELGYLLPPVVADERIFAIDRDGHLTAWQRDKGTFLWEAKLDSGASSGLSYNQEQLYVGTQNGEVMALSATGGQILWRTRLSTEVLSPPQVNNSSHQLVVQTADGKVAALDERTGRILWNYESTEPLLTLHGTATPLVVPSATFTGFANGRVVAIDNRNGQLAWDIRAAVPTGRTDIERLVDVDGQPLLTSKGMLVVTSYQGRLIALDPSSGRGIWERKDSSYYPAVEGFGNILYVDEASNIVALDARSGGVLWNQNALSGRRLTAPVVWGDTLVVADYEGFIHLVSLTDGHIVGRIEADASGIEQPLIATDTILYAVAVNGRLIAIGRQ
ncbi:outer membrane protein assembly factor BamB [Oceanospirillum maris]|uniref:outer membrane protein assembly factor BamB n=1 Tax=Oceanospirillum maris TaxID=64977 RepID=UPI00040D242D|nr:outer membrane protein assembly factor BamB [Oceanospirillum maris]